MSKEKKTIHEQLESFKKFLWSDEQPMEFATNVVEELLLEVQRQQTVMRAGLDEIDQHWESHRRKEPADEAQLLNLMESLGSNRRGFYAQYLSPNEYHEFILRQSNFEAFAKAHEHGEKVEKNDKESE